MFNFYYQPKRDLHADTVRFFMEIQTGKYEAFTSIYVTDELIKADER